MSKTKFTPGPWEAQGLYIMFTNADTKQFDWVAKVERFTGKYKHEEAANAALIAAAPELYEALEKITAHMLAQFPWALSEPLNSIMKASNAALAKARGEKTDEQ
jgi:hypothetical protein